jgi:Neuraminidase (sialidase)
METTVAGRVDKFVALWMAGKSKGSDGIWYAVSTDAGQTWGSRTRLDPSSWGRMDASWRRGCGRGT